MTSSAAGPVQDNPTSAQSEQAYSGDVTNTDEGSEHRDANIAGAHRSAETSIDDAVHDAGSGHVSPAATGGPSRDTSPDQAIVNIIRRQFNEDWYLKTYGPTFKSESEPRETAFDFYMRSGARQGHDPHPKFSECFYRRHNPDVARTLLGTNSFAFYHWVAYGRTEHRITASAKLADEYRKIYKGLDRKFIREKYLFDPTKYITEFDYYFLKAYEETISPSVHFSEEGYLQANRDVHPSMDVAGVVSGYHHYLATLHTEQRSSFSYGEFEKFEAKRSAREAADRGRAFLERNLPGICHPSALDMLHAIEFFTAKPRLTIEGGAKGLLVLVPNFLPEILFGGYLAFFDFLERLKFRASLELRLLVVNQRPKDVHLHNLVRMQLSEPRWFDLFDKIELYPASREINVPAGFEIISYASETHYLAHEVGKALGRTPFFFIQDFEPDFHANTDLYTFSKNAFRLPHRGIYNSDKLLEFFRTKIDVLSEFHDGYKCVAIENPLKTLSDTAANRLLRRTQTAGRNLIFYGRPEGHAARNHFAFFVHALKEAIRQGVFLQHDWSFLSIGSLSFEGELDLGGGQTLRVCTKLPKADYERFLQTGDIGVSFITTPHPGIIHFQMANFGLTTLTNVTELRTNDWLSGMNKNIIGVAMRTESIVEGLRRAVSDCENLDQRVQNARGAKSLTAQQCVEDALAFMTQEVGG